jgi:RecB family endonuclease NucS
MAEEMLFTVAGSVAMPAQMISLEEAGLEQRADLQEWVLSNPAILGPAVKVVTFEFDGLPSAAAVGRDRISVLGLGGDGRLVVAELKSGRSPDTDV